MTSREPNKFNFSPIYSKLFNILKIPSRKLILVGSSSRFIDSVFSGDYDLLVNMYQYNINLFFKRLIRIITEIERFGYYFIELKINKIKYHSLKEITNKQNEIINGLNKDPFCKIDTMLFDGKFLQSVTCVYFFGKLRKEDLINSIKKDIEENIRIQNWIKVLKRINSLNIISNNTKALVETRRILNTANIGALRKADSLIENLDIFKMFIKGNVLLIKIVRENIKQELSSIIDNPKVDYDNVKRILNILVRPFVKEYLSTHNIYYH